MTEAEGRAWADDFFELEIPDDAEGFDKEEKMWGSTAEEFCLAIAISENPKQALEFAQEEHQDFWNKVADHGLNWGDLEISSVGKFERSESSLPGSSEDWAERKVKKGAFSIELTSNGKKLHLMLPCIYSPSTGFHLHFQYFIQDFKPKQ